MPRISLSYANRTYDEVKSAILSTITKLNPKWTDKTESDLGVTLIEAITAIIDMANYYIDNMVNESYVPAARLRNSLLKLGSLLNYIPRHYEPAFAELTFSLSTPNSYDVIIPTYTSVSSSAISGVTVPFYTLEEAIIPAGQTSITAPSVQGQRVLFEVPGSGITSKFKLVTQIALHDSGLWFVKDDEGEWTHVDNFANSRVDSKHFRYEVDSDDFVYVVFGDGYYGRIPDVPVEVWYNQNVGEDGNIGASKITSVDDVIYNTNNESVSVSVTNENPATGGSNPESAENMRALIPGVFASLKRAVTINDFNSLVGHYPGVMHAKCYDVNDDSDILFYAVHVYPVVVGYILDETFKEELLEYLEEIKYVTCRPEIKQVAVTDVDFTGTVNIVRGANSSLVSAEMSRRIYELLRINVEGEDGGIRVGEILRYSDVVQAIETIGGVDFSNVDLNGGRDDINPGEYTILKLGTNSITLEVTE